MPSQPQKLLTAEEYLAFERKAEFKSEYFAGEMFAMVGASQRHNLIAANIIRALGNQLLERPCNVYPSDMRVKISKINKYTYPDIVVACGEEQFENEQNDTLLNPAVIIEILSESTEAYDRGKKFEHYQSLESLREYLLISQDPYRVEQYVRRDDRTWTYFELHQAADTVHLPTIDCDLSLKDIYAKVA
ncbi:MAG TPA: Uma2 family endonuclease [Candidatus Binatia bacterium]|nr:Uma2 family endonuclease [Candidatus Binatia bacterium]